MAEEAVTTTAPETTAPPVTAPVTAAPSWRDTLPDDLKADPSLASFKDIPSLAKSFVETKKMVGAKTEGLVKVPGENATPEERTAFLKALGVPDSPQGYQIKRPQIAAVLGWDEQAEQGFLADAHKAGFTPAQAQAAVDWFAKREAARHEADRATEREAGVALRQEWGANFDAMVGLANRALSQYGGDALVEFLHTSRLGADPRMVKAWAQVGQDLAEHGVISADALGGVDYDTAQAKIRELDAELNKVDPNSERAKELTNQKWRYLAVRR